MKTVIFGNKGFSTIVGEMLRESYGDKVDLVKRFLDKNFVRASMEETGSDGLKKNIGVFVMRSTNGLPSDTTLYKSDVMDILLHNFPNIIGDSVSNKEFLNQVIKDWYDNKITPSGSLTSYNF